MFYLIYQWWQEAAQDGASWAETFSFLRIFESITVRSAIGCLLAFGLSLKMGPWVMRKLISLKVGQPIRSAEEVHKLAELHGAKAGTPTMGGIMIIFTVSLSVLLCARLDNPFILVSTFVMLALGALGFLDDYTKVKKKNSEGVSSRFKLAWQAVVGACVASFLFFSPSISDHTTSLAPARAIVVSDAGASVVSAADQVIRAEKKQTGYWLKENQVVRQMEISEIGFPLFKETLFDLSYFAIPFFIIIIIGASNAMNLTDGLDGLATGCTITTCLAYSLIAYVAGNALVGLDYLHMPFNPQLGELTIFILSMVGAAFGFLWFNCHPAKMFMGDTGSLAIGGSIGTMAICTKQEILLVVIGFVFVMEAVSVILQVGSFKLRGKRIFAMAPIHHHFELRGWYESQVIIRFWIISIISALVGLTFLKIV